MNRLKSSFVTLVSHQFLTPLGIILSATDILDAYFDRLPAERRREQLADIRSGTRHMAELLDQVLLFGQMESGEIHCQPAPLDLAAFCDRLAREIAGATLAKCPIVFEALELTGRRAMADETLLRNILKNLLSNAVNFSGLGSQVRFTVKRSGSDAVFEIGDEDIGIPESDTTHLFTSFQRGTNVGELRGSGLGLVIVKRCVDLHRGNVLVRSRLNQGTHVTVTLPLFPAKPAKSKSARKGGRPTRNL